MPNPPIFYPVFHGDLVAVRELLNADPNALHARDAKDLTPLHVAASRGKHEVLQLLIDRGASTDGDTPPDSWTPLVWASYRGHADAVRVLLENGAGAGQAHGNPIHFAGQRRHRDICQRLVDHGAVDELIDTSDANTIKLWRAAYSFQNGIVAEVLAQHPSLIHSRDRNGRTLLHEVCTHGDIKTARVLLKHGINVDHQDDVGDTALDRATKHRKQTIVRLLST